MVKTKVTHPRQATPPQEIVNEKPTRARLRCPKPPKDRDHQRPRACTSRLRPAPQSPQRPNLRSRCKTGPSNLLTSSQISSYPNKSGRTPLRLWRRRRVRRGRVELLVVLRHLEAVCKLNQWRRRRSLCRKMSRSRFLETKPEVAVSDGKGITLAIRI